ncbi:phosphotransferase [Streptomyces sp. NRRL F-5126]|uniref:phosphotransferase n=1 Tax=Streptomyces sp. NRRL F-5126 TaxID=1463857 RepID=UPI00068E393C|nr:phosphotransferase [Streptomyces sp. NRRL F-5126]
MTETPPEACLDAALPDLAGAFGLGEVRRRRFLADGLMNRNWLVETSTGSYAVKQITDVPLAKVRRNLAMLPGLAHDGLPVPAALQTADAECVVEVAGQGFCALPWVEGTHVQGTDLDHDQAHQLGELLAGLHRSLSRHASPSPSGAPVPRTTDAGTASRAADEHSARFPAQPTEVFDKETVEALHQRKDLLASHAGRQPQGSRLAGPHGWTHGDFQYRNLLRRDGAIVAILDWDRVAVRSYAEEVARTAQVQFGGGGRFSLDRVAAFVSGYRSLIPLSEGDLADAVHRLWWKRATDFWQLEFYFERRDPAFGDLFLADEALLHWWTDHFDEVRTAFATHHGPRRLGAVRSV